MWEKKNTALACAESVYAEGVDSRPKHARSHRQLPFVGSYQLTLSAGTSGPDGLCSRASMNFSSSHTCMQLLIAHDLLLP